MVRSESSNWHLDKRVSVLQIGAIFVQLVVLIVGGVWFVSEFKQQIEVNAKNILHNELEIEELNNEVDAVTARISAQAVSLGRIEEGMRGIRDTMERIESNMNRALDRGNGFRNGSQ